MSHHGLPSPAAAAPVACTAPAPSLAISAAAGEADERSPTLLTSFLTEAGGAICLALFVAAAARVVLSVPLPLPLPADGLSPPSLLW